MAASLFDQYEAEMRQSKNYGKLFSILSDNPYDCDIDDDRVKFGEPNVNRVCGCGDEVNNQDVIIDGMVVGFVHEHSYWNIFKPMTVSFLIPLDDPDVTEEMMCHPNFVEYEWCYLQFATLQQLIDYHRSINNIPKA